jgi:hypothetical protein
MTHPSKGPYVLPLSHVVDRYQRYNYADGINSLDPLLKAFQERFSCKMVVVTTMANDLPPGLVKTAIALKSQAIGKLNALFLARFAERTKSFAHLEKLTAFELATQNIFYDVVRHFKDPHDVAFIRNELLKSWAPVLFALKERARARL